jgi:hypothetical protein
MENLKKGREICVNHSINNCAKWKPEICTKSRFRKSEFSQNRIGRNLPLIKSAQKFPKALKQLK